MTAASSDRQPLTTEEVQRLIDEDPDFVNLKRYGYSLKAVLKAFPDGCPEKLIVQGLLIADDIESIEAGIIAKLRIAMGVDSQ